jgi:hypothetical protein
MWEPRRLTAVWASTVCYRDRVTFLLHFKIELLLLLLLLTLYKFSHFCIFFLYVVFFFSLGPLGTAATNRPIVPDPGDYDDREIGGMMIGR